MRSVFIIHSDSTAEYVKELSKPYDDAFFQRVTGYYNPDICKRDKEFCRDRKIQDVIAIGGGSVIDYSKVIAGKKRCIAYPTTASGAAMTSHAVMWYKDRRENIKTRKPILGDFRKLGIELPKKIYKQTRFDAVSHACESFWSHDKTRESGVLSIIALSIMRCNKDSNNLILAGNCAGDAIEITGTNIIHALSYPLTLHYKFPHAKACGILFHKIVEYLDDINLPELPKMKRYVLPKSIDIDFIIDEAFRYEKIHDVNTRKKINKKRIKGVLEKCRK